MDMWKISSYNLIYTDSTTAVYSQEQIGLIFDIYVTKNYPVSQGNPQTQILMLLIIPTKNIKKHFLKATHEVMKIRKQMV